MHKTKAQSNSTGHNKAIFDQTSNNCQCKRNEPDKMNERMDKVDDKEEERQSQNKK